MNIRKVLYRFIGLVGIIAGALIIWNIVIPFLGHVEMVVPLSKGEIQSKKIRVDFSLRIWICPASRKVRPMERLRLM